MKKRVFLTTLLTATMLFVPVTMCQASTAGITATVELKEYTGKYQYGNGNNILKIRSLFNEIHSTTNQKYINEKSATATPGHTSVVVYRKPDLGYNYTKVDFWGYVNGSCKASLMEVKP